ncbi:MAG: DUF4350 domain-containing protein, partial [Bacteroidota bacterium]
MRLSYFGLLAVFYILISSMGCNQFTWWERYRYNKKQPYDLYALYSLLEARESGLVFHKDTLQALVNLQTTNTNYVYVGQNMFLDEADVTALLNFVEQGNNAFIASKWIPEDLSYHFFGPDCYYYTNDGYYNDVETFYED